MALWLIPQPEGWGYILLFPDLVVSQIRLTRMR